MSVKVEIDGSRIYIDNHAEMATMRENERQEEMTERYQNIGMGIKINSAFDDSDFFNPRVMTLQERQIGIFGIGGGGSAPQDQANSDVNNAYPYPPATCEKANVMIAQIKAAIQTAQETYAGQGCSAGCKRIQDRYILAYQARKGQLENWVLKANCDQQARDKANQDFINQSLGIISDQTAAAKADATGSNKGVYLAIGGLVVIAAILIVVKKSKSST